MSRSTDTAVPREEPTMNGGTAALWAGVARVEVTDHDAGPVNDPLYVKALVLRSRDVAAVIVTVDAVALAEIGPVPGNYLSIVRAALQRELGLDPAHLLVNASHCHGLVCGQVAERTVEAVKAAWQAVEPVRTGVGVGHEDRIMENRRLRLRSGREADVRHAYSLPPDEEIEGIGPVDPEIGILRLDRMDGRTLAVVYHFACHPIQGVPNGGNTADLVGFASRVIETGCGDGAMAFFLQGCAGDVNPVYYKDVDHPRDAEPLGNLLGLSALAALKRIECRDEAILGLVNASLDLPRADLAPFIEELEIEQIRLLESLTGTTLNLKTFLHLVARYGLAPDFPSCCSHRYLHDRARGCGDLDRLDAENRRHMTEYMARVHVMEELTRVRTNLDLLRLHHGRNLAAGSPTLTVGLTGLRIGDLRLITFPGEPSVEIGLRIKQTSPHGRTFVAGYTNGYIYYAPTAAQLTNRGWAQEDSDCELAPEWQALFEAKAGELLRAL